MMLPPPLLLLSLLLLLLLLPPPLTGQSTTPRRIDLRAGPDGTLHAGQIVRAMGQARAMLEAEPAVDVLVQLPAGDFSINTTETPFELSNIAPASGHSLSIAGAGRPAQTVLRFDGLFDVISGRNTSRVRFLDLTFARQR